MECIAEGPADRVPPIASERSSTSPVVGWRAASRDLLVPFTDENVPPTSSLSEGPADHASDITSPALSTVGANDASRAPVESTIEPRRERAEDPSVLNAPPTYRRSPCTRITFTGPLAETLSAAAEPSTALKAAMFPLVVLPLMALKLPAAYSIVFSALSARDRTARLVPLVEPFQRVSTVPSVLM